MPSPIRPWLFAAAVNGAMAVVMQALAAHALRSRLTPAELAQVTLGADFQLWHALALIGVALLIPHAQARHAARWLAMAGIAFVLGIVAFSGGLYVMALSGLSSLHGVAPLGGALLIGGWLCLAALACQREPRP